MKTALLLPAVLVAFGLTACGEDEGSQSEPTVAGTTPGTPVPGSTVPGTTTPGTVPPTGSTVPTTGSQPGGPDPTPGIGGQPGYPDPLAGHTFLSTGAAGFTLVDGSTITITFDGTRIGASGGCNQLGSVWLLDGDRLVVEPMWQTEMACAEPLMQQDTWLADLLASSPTFAVDGDMLTLAGDGGTLTLQDQETADPDRPLEGTKWEVDSLISGDTVSSVPAGAGLPTFTFTDGEVGFFNGCNDGGGPYELDGSEITFGDLITTLKACRRDAGSTEGAVMAVLDGTVTFEIEAGRLTLTNGDVGLGLRAAG